MTKTKPRTEGGSRRATDKRGARIQPDIASAQKVLDAEIRGLQALRQGLGDDGLGRPFSALIDLLQAVRGRVIVSGLGKSGHVARKIAATLASTGTPAHFVHPSEASHGDMGMITRADAVLVLSNSGENRELSDLIAHAKRINVALAAICSRADSTLMTAADFPLLLPGAGEACPMGLAPTTSSTMMLALGDALAVALMERRGFSADDFRVLHPGGQLGKALLRVQDIMHGADELPLVGPDTAVKDALITMTSKRFGCVGVYEKDRGLAGIFTDGDLRRHMGADLFDKSIRDVMTPNPKVIRKSALVQEAVNFMNASPVPFLVLFVVDSEEAGPGGPHPIGILHMHDCLRAGIS